MKCWCGVEHNRDDACCSLCDILRRKMGGDAATAVAQAIRLGVHERIEDLGRAMVSAEEQFATAFKGKPMLRKQTADYKSSAESVPGVASASFAPPTDDGAQRFTAEEVEAVRACVARYLSADPMRWTSCAEDAASVVATLRSALHKLERVGWPGDMKMIEPGKNGAFVYLTTVEMALLLNYGSAHEGREVNEYAAARTAAFGKIREAHDKLTGRVGECWGCGVQMTGVLSRCGDAHRDGKQYPKGAVGCPAIVCSECSHDDHPAPCEGCGKKSTKSDDEGVPLCDACDAELFAETNALIVKRASRLLQAVEAIPETGLPPQGAFAHAGAVQVLRALLREEKPDSAFELDIAWNKVLIVEENEPTQKTHPRVGG